MTRSSFHKSKLIQSFYQLQSIPSVAKGEIINSMENGVQNPLLRVRYSVGQHTTDSHRINKWYNVSQSQSKASFLYRNIDSTGTIKVFNNLFDTQYTLKYLSENGKGLIQLALYAAHSDEHYSINISEKYIDWINMEYLRNMWVVQLEGVKYLVGNFELVASGEHNTSYYWQNDDKKTKHDFENSESWGEQMYKLRMERLFAWTLDEEKVQNDFQSPNEDSKKKQKDETEDNSQPSLFKEIKGIPKDIAVGQFVFSKDGSKIYFVGQPTQPRRYGLIYCEQRPSSLYRLSNWWDDEKAICENLTEHEWNVISPRITPDGETLVFATTTKVPYHKSCLQVVKFDLKESKFATCVDIVDNPSENEFPGLYFGANSFNDRIFTSDSKYIICETHWRSQSAIIRINLKDGNIDRLTTENQNRSLKLLDYSDTTILISESSPTHPYRVLYGKYNSDFAVENWVVVDDSQISLPTSVQQNLSQLEWRLETISVDENIEMEYFIIRKANDNNEDCEKFILCPHGGPHSVVPTDFFSTYAFFALNGFTCVIPNYRGSIGFGQTFIKALPGNCGDYDVKDCYNAMEDAIKKYGTEGKKALKFVRGGSHGGFLALSLIAQYPDYFTSAVAINPVVNIASMVTSTDIPDWCYTEVNLDPEAHIAPTSEFLLSAFEASPISMVGNVKTPTLFLVGKNDLRVPPSQAREMYYALKLRGVKTQMIQYPDNDHPIAKPNDNTDVALRTVDWLQTTAEASLMKT